MAHNLTASCSARHRGPRCAGCARGYMRVGVACVECASSWALVLLTLLLVLWPHIVVKFLEPRASSLRHSIQMMQALALVGSLQGNWGGEGGVAHETAKILGFLRLFLQEQSLSIWSCEPSLHPSTVWILFGLLPVKRGALKHHAQTPYLLPPLSAMGTILT